MTVLPQTWRTEPLPDVILPPAKLPVFDQMLLEERQNGDEDAAIIRLAMEARKDLETVIRLWPYPHFPIGKLRALLEAVSAKSYHEEFHQITEKDDGQ